MLVAVQLFVPGLYLPPVFKSLATINIHPRRSFHCQSTLPCEPLGQSGALVVLVAVQLFVLGLYLPPVFKVLPSSSSTPDDHFTAGPDRCVSIPRVGRVGGAGGCPTIRAGIVSPAGVQIGDAIISAPDDHFAASPHCCVIGIARTGALVVLVAVQLSVLGLYLPPVFK